MYIASYESSFDMSSFDMIKLYQVGGCVRDEILGRPSKDIDYSVEAQSYLDMKQHLVSRGLKILYEKPEYLTIRAKQPDGSVADFVLCRRDGTYEDGRRPLRVVQGVLYDDLSRRDFTMNAIAKDEKGEYIDPFHGREDIKQKIIRCVGGVDRLQEDALRMLRAIRFLVVLPGFKLDQPIHEALQDPKMVDRLCAISKERIRNELEKCFVFDTYKSLQVLLGYPLVMQRLFSDQRMWLKPTFEISK